MTDRFVNIHTHRPTGRGIEPRTAGIHPWNADKEDVSTIVPLLGEVQAVGETGLDFVRGADRAVQLAAFRAQLALAHERQMPVVLHCVRAFEPVMRELDACRPRGKGYYLSFGLRAFASPKTLESLRETPLSQLFLETDDSDVPIEEIYARAAKVKGVTPEELRRATLENYGRIFTAGPQGQDKAAGTPPLPAR